MGRIVKILLMAAVLAPAARPAWSADEAGMPPRLESAYLERRKQTSEGDTEAHVALARWCQEQGFIREMLHALDEALKEEPQHEEARRLLRQEREAEAWVHVFPQTSVSIDTESKASPANAMRDRLINRARNSVFKMAKKARRFNIWTDLDRERVQDYSELLNSYYDDTRGFFVISKTERGIHVVIFSKRSDYLQFFNKRTGKSGEHINGFFTYNDTSSLLCFYDNPYDEEGVFNTARHECTHLMAKQCLQGGKMAHWLDEGLACYYAGNGQERFGSYPANCFLNVRHGLRTNKTIPLKHLMRLPYEEFRFQHYATAWSWVSFFRAKEETRDKLTQLFYRLRKLARDKVSVEWENEEWEEATNNEFLDLFGPPEKLQMAWETYIKKELLPQNGVQRYFYAGQAMAKADGRSSLDPPLNRDQKILLMQEAEGWLRDASNDDDAELKARVQLQCILAILARAKCMEYDDRETIYAVAEGERILEAFLADPANAFLLYDAGVMAYYLLGHLWKKGGYECEEGEACDFISMIKKKEASAKRQLDRESPNSKLRPRRAENLSFLCYQEKIIENLISKARFAFNQALASDPAHRNAALGWLYVALEFSPTDLDKVFPHLLFQVQLDPDDKNLAALSAAYSIMGKREYAGSLLDKAYHITPRKENLKWLASYVTE